MGVRTPGGLLLGVWYAGVIDFWRTPSLPIFTALHEMQTQTRSSDENSVCPSVRPSVKRVDCDETEENSVKIFTALHGMQTRSCDENSVRPSVRLSFRQTREL